MDHPQATTTDLLLVLATDLLLAMALLLLARTIAATMSLETGAAASTIGPADIEPGTDASPDGLCRTVSANRTGATDTKSLPGCFEVSPLGRTTPYTSVLERRPRENAKGRFPAAFFLLELYD